VLTFSNCGDAGCTITPYNGPAPSWSGNEGQTATVACQDTPADEQPSPRARRSAAEIAAAMIQCRACEHFDGACKLECKTCQKYPEARAMHHAAFLQIGDCPKGFW
jgi:hypothetical protein